MQHLRIKAPEATCRNEGENKKEVGCLGELEPTSKMFKVGLLVYSNKKSVLYITAYTINKNINIKLKKKTLLRSRINC